MVPNPRENSRGGRISRETPGRLACVGDSSTRIVSVHRILERPPVVVRYSAKERPRWHRTREGTRGRERISRETSGKQAYEREMSQEQLLYDLILERPPIVGRYSAKKKP